MSDARTPDAATTRLSWHERITRAVETYREWLHVLPNELGMDRAMKAAGFRDVIVENGELRRALRDAMAFVDRDSAADYDRWEALL